MQTMLIMTRWLSWQELHDMMKFFTLLSSWLTETLNVFHQYQIWKYKKFHSGPTRGSIFANTKLPHLPKYLVLWVMTRLCKARMVWSPAFSQPTWWESSLNSFSKGPLPWSWLWYLISWLGSTHWSRSWSFVNTLTVFSEHCLWPCSIVHLVAAQVVHLAFHHSLPTNVHLKTFENTQWKKVSLCFISDITYVDAKIH